VDGTYTRSKIRRNTREIVHIGRLNEKAEEITKKYFLLYEQLARCRTE
jgi:hypothetical protein